MGEEILERKLFSSFDKYEEFVDAQSAFLSLDLFEDPSAEDDQKERVLFNRLSTILATYQEQSYLLDPFLEKLVVPVVECLKLYARRSTTDGRRGSPTRVERIALLLHSFVKCRGYKTIIRYLPHEIADLSIALDFLLLPDGLVRDSSQWALRYIVLIWLTLVCMIPFDLAQFDDINHVGRTAVAIETVAKHYLGKAGVERDAASLLLSRVYMRKDTSSRFHPFLEWSKAQLGGNGDIVASIGLLQVTCEVLKSAPAEQIQAETISLFAVVGALREATLNNTAVRKYKVKLVSRIALRMLPARANISRRKARILSGDAPTRDAPVEEDIEVPDQVETVLEQLFGFLQDRDTVVRYSAAKGVARISERLPAEFADQVLETIMGLFSIHSLAAASLYDLPAIAESTWHGACLACAEMARRGVVAQQKLPELIDWLSKALYFDIRKGAHSIGSNVRDAAAYALWALARTQNSSVLVAHADKLARHLATAALYDREIHIRRAASAAFQEHVGRNNLFPHGIDVLGKTDFYAVSVRKNAFLTAAPQVGRHPEYRAFLLDHVLNVVLRHWDQTMRELGSQSVHLICLLDLPALGPETTSKAIKLLESFDIADLHGGLLTLCEIARAYRDSGEVDLLEGRMCHIFKQLSLIPMDVVCGARNAIVTTAACRLISITLTLTEIHLGSKSSVPKWREIVEYGLKHRNTVVQEAAADAMSSFNKFIQFELLPVTHTSSEITLIRELKTSSPTTQQSFGTLLGALDYDAHPNSLSHVLESLLDCVKPSSPMKSNAEARRNCYMALPRILNTTIGRLTHHMSPEVVASLHSTLLHGLEDYSVDERGDVGSWIRLACIQGLTRFAELLIPKAASIPDFGLYFPPARYQQTVAGILKQGVERLDNVRLEAGECFMRLINLALPDVHNGEDWRMPGLPLLKELFQGETEVIDWNDGNWLFPKAVRLLEVPEYRKPILTGLILSLGSKTDSTQRPVAASLVSYVRSLPVSAVHAAYDANSLVEDLLDNVKAHVASNLIVVPILQTFNLLLAGGALNGLSDNSHGIESLQQLLSIVTRNVSRLKSIPRMLESMKITVHLLPFQPLFNTCVQRLAEFLTHQFPSIRRDTAEFLYVMLQGTDIGRDTDDVEDILLETEWSSNDLQVAREASEHLISVF